MGGEARAIVQFENPTSFSARDEFDQSAGNLGGKTAAVGGPWTTAGAPTDFAVEATGKTAQRTALEAGRFAIIGSNVAASISQVDFKFSAIPSGSEYQAVAVARYVSTSSYTVGKATVETDGTTTVQVASESGSGEVALATAFGLPPLAPNVWHTVRLLVDSADRWFLWVFRRGAAPGLPVLQGHGGLNASTGKVGFGDSCPSSSPVTRNYDNFVAFVPTPDAAIFANQSLEIRHDRVIREDPSGTYWSPVSDYEGFYLRIPPAGQESRTTRIIVKASRNDPETMMDPAIDDLNVQLVVTPRRLVVPKPS